jgi:hypothetical protein
MIKKAILFLFISIFLIVGLGTFVEANVFSPKIINLTINNPISIGTENYFSMSIVAENNDPEIASVEAVIKDSSKKNIVKIALQSLNQDWYSSFSIPSDHEKGLWSVEEIIFKDKVGTIKKYYSSEINKTFFVEDNSSKLASNATLIEQKKQTCIQSKGTWSEKDISCDCPLNYQLQESGSCLYSFVKPVSNNCVFTYSEWSSCQENGTKERTVNYFSNCSSSDEPILLEECDYPEDEKEVIKEEVIENPTKISCFFNYSDWSSCQENGTKERTISSSSNCYKKDEPILLEECEYSENNEENISEEVEEIIEKPTKISCIFTYSDWSSCQTNGTQTRKLVYKMPANCSEGEPILARDCKYVPVSPIKEISDSFSKEIILEKNLNNDFLIENINNKNEEVSLECFNSGINSKEDCEIYNYQLKIIPECLFLNLGTLNQCKDYFLINYGKPLKCKNINEESCNNLIENVILSDLKNKGREENKTELLEFLGKKTLITKKDDGFILKIKKDFIYDEQKEIYIENLPIFASGEKSISAIFLPIEQKFFQQEVYSFAMALSSEENNLPDDVKNRIGENFNLENISGIDRAIISGKILEQPKYNYHSGKSLSVGSVETIENNEDTFLKIRGKALPGQVVTLFVYSTFPLLATVQADQNGNWQYILDKSMSSGAHEVYAAIHNEEGKIIDSSFPKTFFIKDKQSITLDEFFLSGKAIDQFPEEEKKTLNLYLAGGLSILIILISVSLILKERLRR